MGKNLHPDTERAIRLKAENDLEYDPPKKPDIADRIVLPGDSSRRDTMREIYNDQFDRKLKR
jgi:hypothetical protein